MQLYPRALTWIVRTSRCRKRCHIRDVDSTNGNGRGVLLTNLHEDGSLAMFNYTNTDGTTGATQGRLEFDDIAGDISVTNAEIMGGTGYAVSMLNVESTSTISLIELDYNGGTAAAGAIRANIYDGALNVINSTLEGGTLNGVSILGQSDGTFNFQDTVTMTNLGNSVGGIGFEIDGGALNQFTGTVTVANDIDNSMGAGRSVAISNISTAGTSVTFSGDITDNGAGILVNGNTGGTILFLGDLDVETETNTAILVSDNTGADISFSGPLDITTTSGNGFEAIGGGTLTASNTGNSVTTETGQIVKITNMTLSNAGANFADVNRTASAGTFAIQLETNTGGPITFGAATDSVGDAGTIVGGTVDAILVRDSADVAINGIRINNTSAVSGILVNKTNNNAMTVDISDVETNAGDIGLEVHGNGTTANLNMQINDVTVNNATQIGMRFNDVDAGSIDVNNGDVTGGGATAGVQILNSNATFDFDAASQITGVTGTDFDVFGGTPVITMAGDITNTAGTSVQVQNVTGGSVNFTAASSITDTAGGLRDIQQYRSARSASWARTNSIQPTTSTPSCSRTTRAPR